MERLKFIGKASCANDRRKQFVYVKILRELNKVHVYERNKGPKRLKAKEECVAVA